MSISYYYDETDDQCHIAIFLSLVSLGQSTDGLFFKTQYSLKDLIGPKGDNQETNTDKKIFKKRGRKRWTKWLWALFSCKIEGTDEMVVMIRKSMSNVQVPRTEMLKMLIRPNFPVSFNTYS